MNAVGTDMVDEAKRAVRQQWARSHHKAAREVAQPAALDALGLWLGRSRGRGISGRGISCASGWLHDHIFPWQALWFEAERGVEREHAAGRHKHMCQCAVVVT